MLKRDSMFSDVIDFHGGINKILEEHNKGFKLSYIIENEYPSALDCRCGSKLTEIRSIINPRRYALWLCGPEPRVKTRRKRKVVIKKYRRTFRMAMMAAFLVAPLRNRPFYRCESCGNRMGFYQAIATNIIKVEPMPPGAVPYYLDHDKS
jgi:hypothetical protein